MKFDEMTVEELETRQAEIAGMETDGVETEEIERRASDLEAIKNELEARKKAAEEAEEIRRKIADGEIGETKEEFKEEKKMTDLEIRGSHEYAEAFKNYIIKRGETVEIPEALAEVITNAEKAEEYAMQYVEEKAFKEPK